MGADFLWSARALASTSAFPQDTVSPFGECIVVATIAGRALSHRLQAAVFAAIDADGDGPGLDIGTHRQNPTRYDFWDRHAELESLLARGMSLFAEHYPPAVQEHDPMLLFIAMLWRALALYLWHTAETFLPVAAQIRSTQSSQLVEDLSRDMMRLMDKLSELNSWKVRP